MVGTFHLVPSYTLSGALVGVLVGLTGVGGGSLMTPLLVLMFGFAPSTAVGTDLLFASATKAVGTSIHNACRGVDWRIVGRLALGSVPAAALTLLVIAHYGATSHTISTAISLTLGVALLISAISLLLRDRVMAIAMRRHPDFGLTTSFGLTVAVGFVVGVLVSLSSVGAGALGTVALLFLYPRLPIARVVGSDIAHAVPLTLLAGVGHWYLGSVDLGLLASLLLGSIPGIIVGSYLAGRVPEYILKPSLGAVLTLVAVKLLTA
jgi:uncharacterized protein